MKRAFLFSSTTGKYCIAYLLSAVLLIAATDSGAEDVSVTETDAEQSTQNAAAEKVADKAPKSSAADIDAAELLRRLDQQQEQLNEQQQLIEEQRRAIQSMQTEVDRVSGLDPSKLTEAEIALRNRLETLEDSIAKSQDSATVYITDEFPNSIPIPGSTAAIRIGGFVKANMAINLDTIESQDRFIVGSIPTDPDAQGDSEVNLTVNQSRLNFDLRDRREQGVLRAFIEADFAEEDDTFRLRHAFGQFQKALIGKTDSAFVDVEARPEEIDFEGINGIVNLRQTQVRFSPELGKDWNLIISIEDAQPEVTDGDGVSQVPDVVLSVRRTWFERWHIKTGLLLRKVRARWIPDPDMPEVTAGRDDNNGIAVTLSGNTPITWWDERDRLFFQFNAGRGYGRYINDLASEGGQDAYFDPDGNLRTPRIAAGYIAFQHWWAAAWRSSFIASFVDINTYDWQDPNAYDHTKRISGNLIWSPHPRIDLGSEVIWGKRTDRNGDDGDASQVQVSAKYRF